MNFLFLIDCFFLQAVIAQPSVLNSNDSSVWLSFLEDAFLTADVSDVSNETVDSKNRYIIVSAAESTAFTTNDDASQCVDRRR